MSFSSFKRGCIQSEKLEHRREADIDFHYIHLCCTFPLTDIAIDVPCV